MKNKSLWNGLAIQGRVIGGLLLREAITRYGRHGIGVMWVFGEPMLFTLGIAGVWYLGNLHILSDIPIVAFAITGYSSVLVWRNAANRSANAIEMNVGLMYHRNVKVIDILLSRIFLEIAGGTASLIFLTVLFTSINLMSWPYDILIVISGWLLQCWFAVALGILVGAISEFSETFERVWHVLTYLMFPVSGAVFLVEWLPKNLQETILYLPMVHGAEMIRHGYFGDVIHTHENPFYYAVVNMVLMLAGLLLARHAGLKVRPE